MLSGGTIAENIRARSEHSTFRSSSIKLSKIARDLFFVPKKRFPAKTDVANYQQQVIDQYLQRLE
jgi:hypothetical protein